jgi:ketosteroid isomerase-like protein
MIMSRFTSFSVRAALLLLAIAGCKTVPRYQGNGEQEVLNVEHEWVNATLRQDADAFASFLDDDYVALDHDGSLIRKPGWTRAIRNKTTHYDAVELSNLQVRFPRLDVAVVTGDFMQKGMTGARDNSMVGRYINTWVRKHDKWQLVSSGFAPMPKPR